MITGLLTGLKIAGIVLLIILVVILVLLLLILFVPIRYKGDVLIPETNLDEGFDVQKLSASARFSWLLFVVRGGIDFPENKEFFIRIFGIKIFPRRNKEESEGKKTKDKGRRRSNSKKGEESDKSGIIEKSDMGDLETKENAQNPDAAKGSEKDKIHQEKNADDAGAEDEEKSFLDVLWNIIDGIHKLIETPQNVFKKIQYTISRVCGKISMIKSTLENDIFKRAFELVKGRLIKLIRIILPDKYRIKLLLGLGDPADTAQLYGLFGMLYPITGRNVSFEPDFDNKSLMLEAHFKGHITVFLVIYSAAVCYFNRDVKKVIKRFKKILKS